MGKYFQLILEIIILVSLAICGITIFLYFNNFNSDKYSISNGDWGTFGDYIGGIAGTIFSFISVILIYMNLKSQTENSTLQQFETTFFNLLSNQREILKSLKGIIFIYQGLDSGINKFAQGGDYIETISREVEKRIKLINESAKNSYLAKKDFESEIQTAYQDLYKGKESELGHYFRHLYHIVKYTDESKVKDKKKYIDILQAQMSDNELYVTFYNAISTYGKERFLPLLDKYKFFENIISRGELFDIHKKLFYTETKFKDNAKTSK